MIRVSGVILPERKHVVVALTSIYGVGDAIARRLCEAANLVPTRKVSELSDEDGVKIQEAINDLSITVEGDLRRQVAMSIKRLVDIKSYRGMRHRRGLPVRGQRTKTNARTRKGRKKGSGTKK